jgi:hypothetical protein
MHRINPLSSHSPSCYRYHWWSVYIENYKNIFITFYFVER